MSHNPSDECSRIRCAHLPDLVLAILSHAPARASESLHRSRSPIFVAYRKLFSGGIRLLNMWAFDLDYFPNSVFATSGVSVPQFLALPFVLARCIIEGSKVTVALRNPVVCACDRASVPPRCYRIRANSQCQHVDVPNRASTLGSRTPASSEEGKPFL